MIRARCVVLAPALSAGLLGTAVCGRYGSGFDRKFAAILTTSRRDSVGIAFPGGEGRLMPDRTTDERRAEHAGRRSATRPAHFHALYEAMPPGTRAELIDGVVYMPSPLGHAHGRAQVPVIVWLGSYLENTPGVDVLDNATTILGWKSEPQPDALLRILPECGGRSHEEEGYIHGAPELVVEVSKATRYMDLGPKKADYERAGVLEYVVRDRTGRNLLVPSGTGGAGGSSRSETMDCIARRCFRASGSTRPHF